MVNPEPSISEEAKKFFDITVSEYCYSNDEGLCQSSALADKNQLVIHTKSEEECCSSRNLNTAKRFTYTNKNNESKERSKEPVKVTPP